MKKLVLHKWLCAAALSAAASLPTHAAVVTFEDLLPSGFGPGETFVSGGLSFSVPEGPFFGNLQPGFGAVDTAASLASFNNVPTGNLTQFYAGLNDNFVRMSSGNGLSLRLSSFDFGFIPPVTIPDGASPGAMIAYWTDINGSNGSAGFDFGNADGNGDWAFLRANMSAPTFGLGTSSFLSSVTFFACLYRGTTCFWPAGNQAQFAIDNIDFELPTPSTWLLAGLGLAGLAVTRRRTAR